MVHRDYNSVNGFLQISIFSDRTEISNYGGLPAGITIKDLKKEHNSILRNPDIAQTCFIRKYIEMLGSGTLRMISDCKKNGFRIPVWTDKDNVTTVTFPDLSIKTKATKGVNEELNAIYSVIEKTPGLKAPAIASALGVSLSTAERYIKKLKDANYIKFVGVPKTGGYFIK
jgi:ATP-dependent DNA helicase RecG